MINHQKPWSCFRVKYIYDFMRIGDLSKKTGLTIEAIRFYEKSGLIKKPPRTEGGYRDFGPDAAAAIEFISHCRSLYIPISQIKKLLSVRSGLAKSCKEANDVIDVQLNNLRERIKAFKKLEKSLSELGSVCKQETAPLECAIIRKLGRS